MKDYFLDYTKVLELQKILDSWKGTPYLHMGTTKGKGADCTKFLGLVFAEMGILKGLKPHEFYSSDWHIHGKTEIVINSIDLHAKDYISPGFKIARFYYDKDQYKPLPGDFVLMCTNKYSGLSNHAGMVYDNEMFYHCLNGIGVVKAQIQVYQDKFTYFYRVYEV